MSEVVNLQLIEANPPAMSDGIGSNIFTTDSLHFFFFWATLHITEGLIKTYLLARQADLLKPPEPKDTNTLALLPTPEPK